MKLETNKTSIKGPTIKIKNKNNKYWSLNTNNKDDQIIIFGRRGEKIREINRSTRNKLNHHRL